MKAVKIIEESLADLDRVSYIMKDISIPLLIHRDSWTIFRVK